MPRLHSKGGPEHVCKTCTEECVPWEGIFCDDCGNWLHIKCEQLEIQILQAFKEVPEMQYVCKSCRTDDRGAFNYADSLQRLHKAAKHGLEQLYIAVESERLLMKENLNYSTKMLKFASDQTSQQLLAEHIPGEKRRAIRVTRDENSLFSAVSVALCGSEKLATELRVRCCIEMVVYESYYKWQKNYIKMSECAPEYSESCIDCATPNEDSCVWTLSALSTVVRRPIRSVYPEVNGRADHAVDALNALFHPRNKVDDGEELKILWGTTHKVDDAAAGTWVPDIFVPLMDVPTVQMSPMAMMQRSHGQSRFSGRMRKPTPKLMAIASKDKNQMRVFMREGESDDEDALDDSDGDPNFEMSQNSDLEEVNEDFFPSPRVKMENVDFGWMDKYTHVAVGGNPLKGTNFLPAQEIFNALTTTSSVLPAIPTGRKEDVFFIVDNTRNLKYRHRRNYFQDDCGRYNQKSGTTCKSYYLLTPDMRLVPLIKHKDKYCRESKRVSLGAGAPTPRGRGRPPGRRGRGRPRSDAPREDKVTQWIPMEPQPDEDKVVTLNRYYSSLEIDPTYRRRISWFLNLPKDLENGHNAFMVEYLTKAPPGILLPATRKAVTNIDLHAEPSLDMHVDDGDDSQAGPANGTEEENQDEPETGEDDAGISTAVSSEKEGVGDGETAADASENADTSENADASENAASAPQEEEEGASPSKENQTPTSTEEESPSKVESSPTKEATSPNKDATSPTKEVTSPTKEDQPPTPRRGRPPNKDKSLASTKEKDPDSQKEKTASPEKAEKAQKDTGRKRTVSEQSDTDGGRGKRRKIPSAKARESGSQADLDSD